MTEADQLRARFKLLSQSTDVMIARAREMLAQTKAVNAQAQELIERTNKFVDSCERTQGLKP